MGEKMRNVFDLVAEFYGQDEGWNEVLSQNYVESFLRMQALQGATEEQLVRCWEHLTIFVIYLGNADILLGDLSKENFVDCIAWCLRNVIDFKGTIDYIEEFSKNIASLYNFLKKKKVIVNARGPLEGKDLLLKDGNLQIINMEGEFLPTFHRYRLFETPDLPRKVFLNVGEQLEKLLYAMQTFFSDKKYERELKWAAYLFKGIFVENTNGQVEKTDEETRAFADYFIFDYHMLAKNVSPLQYFYEESFGNGKFNNDLSIDLIQELLEARLLLFTVVKKLQNGDYVCRDFFTKEEYYLTLPIEEEMDLKGYIFLGHLMCENTMLFNFLRGFKLNKTQSSQFLKIMTAIKKWFSPRFGKEITWNKFLYLNPVLLRHLLLLHSVGLSVNNTDRLENYNALFKYKEPHSVVNDAVSSVIKKMMIPEAFSAQDVELAQSMWSDFVYISAKDSSAIRAVDSWASGVIYNFVKLNLSYKYNREILSSICHGLDVAVLKRYGNKISQELCLVPWDSRYMNEESILLMLLE